MYVWMNGVIIGETLEFEQFSKRIVWYEGALQVTYHVFLGALGGTGINDEMYWKCWIYMFNYSYNYYCPAINNSIDPSTQHSLQHYYDCVSTTIMLQQSFEYSGTAIIALAEMILLWQKHYSSLNVTTGAAILIMWWWL